LSRDCNFKFSQYLGGFDRKKYPPLFDRTLPKAPVIHHEVILGSQDDVRVEQSFSFSFIEEDWPTRMKTALILGVSGQDGSYLAEYLDCLGYGVFGVVRRNSVPEHQESRLEGIRDKVSTMYGDLMDPLALARIFDKVQPNEVYNLAAQSHVRISSEIPSFTSQVNALGVLNVLALIAESGAKDTNFYQASSSEMFGDSVDEDGYQRETTPMHPVSPYGCAKLYGYHITRHYRKAFGMHASNGILFNHESPRRASNFVTSKVVKTAVEISLGLKNKLEMGNLDSHRDWGHSRDYVRAIHLITTASDPGDYVVATGITRSVRDMCEYVFTRLGMNYQDYVEQNVEYLRPEELPYLRGDASRIKTDLGWVPKISFEEMMDEMIVFWQNALAGTKTR
jgi:GDPmannose 4,6-dehydratase